MTYPGLDIAGKACFVAGGTSGLGRAIAFGFAQAGARVMVGSTNPDKVSAMAKELGEGHGALHLDVCDAASARSAIDSVVHRFGRIDALVNAAGILHRKPAMDLEVEDFERVVRINLTGSFVIAQAAGRVMRDQAPDERGVRGAIVNVASLSSFVSLSEVLPYACSKSGILALTRGLANEWAALGIRVNAIAPGVFPTDLNRPLIEGTERGRWFKSHTPLARFGDAEELVGAAIYLVSPAASFTTGETLVVDGGYLARGV
jgi:NAD(P)-dependent dehydrogenase (short-subunit alcohol dehydrogenase family)